MNESLCRRTGKISHATHASAARQLRSMRAVKHYVGGVYRCDACGGFHVGSSDKQEIARRRERDERRMEGR